MLAVNFSCGSTGLKSLFLRLFALPLAIGSMWIFYSNVGVCIRCIKHSIYSVYDNVAFQDDSKGFYSKNGMILNVLGVSYGCGILSTISICMTQFSITFSVNEIFKTLIHQIVPQWRKRFYHDSADGLYSGVSLLLAFNAVSIPFSIISAALATCVLYPYVNVAMN